MTSLTGKHSITKFLLITRHHKATSGERQDIGFPCRRKERTFQIRNNSVSKVLEDISVQYRGADKSLARPERKQARKHVKDARDFNNNETRAVIKFFFSLQGKAPKEIHSILTEILTCFLPSRAKDLSAPL